MIYLIYILLLAGFAFFFVGLLPKASDSVSVFGEELKQSKRSMFTPFLSILVPFNKVILKTLGSEKSLGNKLTLIKWKITPAEFLSAKELLPIFTVLMLVFMAGVKSPIGISIGAIFGFLLPDIIMGSKVKKRKYAIVRILPETVDLLSLCVGAGLDFMAAVRWVTAKAKINPLIEELLVVLKEINVGKPRLQALKDMSQRLDIPDVTSFVRTLVQADRMGTPVEEAFKILSEDTSMRRFHRGERTAMKAPIKMLIPLIFCILPVIMIIVAGPIIIQFMTKGLFGLAQ